MGKSLCIFLTGLDVDKRHDKWVTPLGRVFEIGKMFGMDFEHPI